MDGRASHRCVLNRRSWSVHNRLGVTRASAGAGHSGLCLPTNVGVTEYLLSACSIHARGEGRRARMYARSHTAGDSAVRRRRHNGNGGAVRAKRYAKLCFAQFARARMRLANRPIGPITYTG